MQLSLATEVGRTAALQCDLNPRDHAAPEGRDRLGSREERGVHLLLEAEVRAATCSCWQLIQLMTWQADAADDLAGLEPQIAMARISDSSSSDVARASQRLWALCSGASELGL